MKVGHDRGGDKTPKQAYGFAMKSVLVISSFVGGSNVGGSLAMKVLPQLGLRVSLLPTTLLGRHPGWGAPGGGPVPQDLFEGMAEGLIANHVPGQVDCILTGYFATAEQVALAARMISDHAVGRVPVIVDPIMGDVGKGLYVDETVADAIVSELLPLASVITPNSFEFWEIERRLRHDVKHSDVLPERSEIRAQLARYREPFARYVTSVHDSGHVGIMGDRGQGDVMFAARPFIKDKVPNGTGDLAALLLLQAELNGQTSADDLDGLVHVLHQRIRMNEVGELNAVF